MTDLSAFRAHWTEKRPQPQKLTIEERQEWQKEYCKSWYYVDPTPTANGYFVVIDCDGQVTKDQNFDDAMDRAAAKFKEANS